MFILINKNKNVTWTNYSKLGKNDCFKILHQLKLPLRKKCLKRLALFLLQTNKNVVT